MKKGLRLLLLASRYASATVISAVVAYVIAISIGIVNPRYAKPEEVACAIGEYIRGRFSDELGSTQRPIGVLVARLEFDDGSRTRMVTEALSHIEGLSVHERCSPLEVSRDVDHLAAEE